jgi:hypothetical protein
MFRHFLILLLTFPATTVAAGVSVMPVRITEVRVSNITNLGKGYITFCPPGMTVTLRVTGDDIKGATKRSEIELLKANDDVGTHLQDAEGGWGFENGWKKISRSELNDAQKAAGTFTVDVVLALPPRKASEIRELKGEFKVRANGKITAIAIRNLQEQTGREITQPALKEAGVKLRVLKPETDATNTLRLEVSGNMDSLLELEVEGKSHEDVVESSDTTKLDGKRITNYQLNRALDNSVTLNIQVAVGQKTVTVPFDLHDLKLP